VWQAERVDPWNVGLIVVIVVGLGLIIYGALSDRSRNKQRAAAMVAPPQRAIPRFKPDAPAPHYLSDLQARQAPEDAESTDLTEDERKAITAEFTDPSTVTIKAGYASRDFVTDKTSSWAVLELPAILVCGDAVSSFRELLGILEKLILTKKPLVVAAPSIGPEVLATLEVNRIRQSMHVLVVKTDQQTLAALADACGARVVTLQERQSGEIGEEQLGSCERWVSTATTSYLIGPPGAPPPST
jgi:hypothetical protein